MLFVYSAVGTTWDKDFRICLVLSSLKMDLVYEKNSEFYVPDEQVSETSSRVECWWCSLRKGPLKNIRNKWHHFQKNPRSSTAFNDT